MNEETGNELLSDAFAKTHESLERQGKNLQQEEQRLRKQLEPLRNQFFSRLITLGTSGVEGTVIDPSVQESIRNELRYIDTALKDLPKKHQERADALEKLKQRMKTLEAMLMPDHVSAN